MHYTSCSSQAAHPTCARRGKSNSDEDESRRGASPRRNTVTAHLYVRSVRSMPFMPYYCLLLVHPMTVVHLRLLLVLLPLPTSAGPDQRPAGVVRILKDGVRAGEVAICDDDATAGHGATCAHELHCVLS
jgi:hypothetical protein